jgi:hypothetical protein
MNDRLRSTVAAVVLVATLPLLFTESGRHLIATYTARHDAIPAALQSADAPVKFTYTTIEGVPLSWRACGPVDVLVADNAPAGALDALDVALADLSAATGFTWERTGTVEPAHPQAADPHRTLGPGREVRIYFSLPGRSDFVKPASSAAASSRVRGGQIDGGVIVVNSDHWAMYGDGPGGGMRRSNLFLHELGHVVGLDHVLDPFQLLNPHLSDATPTGFSTPERDAVAAAIRPCS